ncbi:uncharacterized protein LOC124912212 [Impatiens glandulifera]|uniref:uncharacterized protein LOC124912212 n=1 Tax=Impatiens glandulifera TaxID=253017 RepID=UPI001FB15B4E|nr:uncharacterized protein LOC124912212 [Impatiens glandulifera]
MEKTDSTEKSPVDLESGTTNRVSIVDERHERPLMYSILRSLNCVDDGNNVSSTTREERIQEQVAFFAKTTPEKEKHKRSNNKKASKPPRPPKGPALDAADVKLIKEISELAMKKRARIEHMKSLRKMKEIKSSKPSRSSISAMAITVLFFFVIIFQGLSSKVNSHNVSFQGSPEPSMAASSMILIKFFDNPSRNHDNTPNSDSPYSVEQDSG